jgi:hypothetical protein
VKIIDKERAINKSTFYGLFIAAPENRFQENFSERTLIFCLKIGNYLACTRINTDFTRRFVKNAL